MSRLLASESTPIPTESSTARMPPVPNEFPQGLYLPSPHKVLALMSVGAAADRPNDRHGVLELLGISPGELGRYEDFDGLNIWSSVPRYGMTCLFVAVPGQGNPRGVQRRRVLPRGLHHHCGTAAPGRQQLHAIRAEGRVRRRDRVRKARQPERFARLAGRRRMKVCTRSKLIREAGPTRRREQRARLSLSSVRFVLFGTANGSSSAAPQRDNCPESPDQCPVKGSLEGR